MKISARNVWLGTVAKVEKGAVNSVVTVALRGSDTIVSVNTDNSVQRLGLELGSEVLVIVKAGGNTVTSIITSASVKRLELKEGMKITAVIKASDVLLATA